MSWIVLYLFISCQLFPTVILIDKLLNFYSRDLLSKKNAFNGQRFVNQNDLGLKLTFEFHTPPRQIKNGGIRKIGQKLYMFTKPQWNTTKIEEDLNRIQPQ